MYQTLINNTRRTFALLILTLAMALVIFVCSYVIHFFGDLFQLALIRIFGL